MVPGVSSKETPWLAFEGRIVVDDETMLPVHRGGYIYYYGYSH